MKESTIVTQKGGQQLLFDKLIPMKKALFLARNQGLAGRLEIQHLLSEDLQEYTLSLYFITEENKIVGRIYPYGYLDI